MFQILGVLMIAAAFFMPYTGDFCNSPGSYFVIQVFFIILGHLVMKMED